MDFLLSMVLEVSFFKEVYFIIGWLVCPYFFKALIKALFWHGNKKKKTTLIVKQNKVFVIQSIKP